MGPTSPIITRLPPRLPGVLAALTTLTVVFGLGTLYAPAAMAANELVSSTPASNASLPASPATVDFVFADPLGPSLTAVATCNGEPFAIGNAAAGADGVSASVPIPNPMPKGTCTVVLTVSALDSTPNGQFPVTFTITADAPAVVATVPPTAVSTAATASTAVPTTLPATPTGTDGASTAPKVGGPLGLARVLAMFGLAVLLGSLVLIVTAWPEGVEYILTVRFLRSAWALSIVGSLLTVVVLRAQVAGESIGASISPATWVDLTDTAPGLAALARLGLAAACFWVVMRPERCLDPGTQLPALALPVLAVATFGLSRTGGDLAVVGVVAGVAHAVAMAVWLGGLVLLSRVVLAGPGEDDLVHAVRGFSRISTPALLLTVLTGAVQTWRLDGGTLFETSHGRVLLLKALSVGAMVFVGLATRQFVRDRLRKVDSMTAPLASRLRRATGLEAAGGILVLVLTAWLLSMQPSGLSAQGSGPDYDTEMRLTAADLDVTVMLTGEVGRNGLRVEVASPASGLSQMMLTFTAPAGTTAASVVLTVPTALTGTGAAVLDEIEGIPLEGAGVWTLQVDATTAAGPQTILKNFTVAG
ncbi:MAG: CopD family protein [Actinomycetota bacterium]